MWIVLEGLDRTGKSTVADHFVSEGFTYVHFMAPDKKYKDPSYSGPSYLEDTMAMLKEYDGQDVVFDRSWYGEMVWPKVYGRDPQLSIDELSLIKRLEAKNNVKKYLMIDSEVEAHWQRCVDNKEPLDRQQFNAASRLFGRMAHTQEFIPMSLGDFNAQIAGNTWEADTPVEEGNADAQGAVDNVETPSPAVLKKQAEPIPRKSETPTQIKEKLEKANAINSILSKRIVKQKGLIFDAIEGEIKNFLGARLSELMGTGAPQAESLSKDEVQMLKMFCKQWQSKAKRG